MRDRGKTLASIAAMVAVVLMMSTVLAAEKPAKKPKADEAAPRPTAQLRVEAAGPVQLPEHWVGLGCEPVPEALRAQLGLKEGQGLLVETIADNSPAAKAGFQRYDVLITADGKALGSLEDLIEAVRKAGGKKMTFEVLRKGKKITIDVTPEKRPPEARPAQPFRLRRPFALREFEQWLEEPFGQPGRRFRFRFFGPGAILPPRIDIKPPLPGNLQITITKKGDEPAKIIVQRDGKKWEVTEDQLDKLPEDIRIHVRRFFGPWWELGPGRVRVWDLFPEWAPPRSETRLPRRGDEELKRRLDETERRLKELEKRLEQLQPSQPEKEKSQSRV